MVQSSLFKTQISLSDYSYRRDIEHRSLIAHLTVFEVEILKEILHDSLVISIESLSENLDVDPKTLIPILDSLSRTKLFKRENQKLIVDKEIRKYYESQMEKFEEDFEPNLEFLQSLLSKVPLHVLLLWYTIPRTADNIFAAIIEQSLLTPKIYRLYLQELQFANPIIHLIIEDLYKAPDFKLNSEQIINKYQLTREQFEEYLLLLEYHLVCCLSYNKIDDEWQEVVTPFSEWLNYLQFEKNARPKPLTNHPSIKKACENEFGFIEDMATVLKACQESNLPINQIKNLNLSSPNHLKALENKLFQLGFVKKSDKSALISTEKGLIWASKPLTERISTLATNPLNSITNFEQHSLWNFRNVRLIEKSLRSLKPSQWFYLEDYLKGIYFPLGEKEAVTLRKRGKRWKYTIPEYTSEDLEFVSRVIMERCFELGIVMVGQHDEQPCFYLTPHGNHFIH
jgi:predicted transcriptional regulator